MDSPLGELNFSPLDVLNPMNVGTPSLSGQKVILKANNLTLDNCIIKTMPLGKRLTDLLFVLLLAPALLCLTLLMIIITKLRSPGPIFFRQERIGFNGKPFTCFKLRTMHVGSSSSSHQQYIQKLFSSGGPMTKMEKKGDPRMIPGGGTFRASGMDEIPQIINILRGEMTLVGPRPFTAYEHELLSIEQKERTKVVPGLTGLWQVSGKNHTSVQEMLRLDLHYVRNQSFLLDLKIILKTFPMLVAQMFESRLRWPWSKRLAVRLQDFFHLHVPPEFADPKPVPTTSSSSGRA